MVLGITGTPTTGNLSDLIIYVRLKIGDMDSSSYRYTDEWITTALKAAVEYTGKWFNFKYLIEGNTISRNPNYTDFIFDEATYGVLEGSDGQIIVLFAAYIMLEGSLENSAWDAVSWRDAEISYSNLESARSRNRSLERLWNEIESMLKPPMKRLARTVKGTLPGYKGNEYEIGNMDY